MVQDDLAHLAHLAHLSHLAHLGVLGVSSCLARLAFELSRTRAYNGGVLRASSPA